MDVGELGAVIFADIPVDIRKNFLVLCWPLTETTNIKTPDVINDLRNLRHIFESNIALFVKCTGSGRSARERRDFFILVVRHKEEKLVLDNRTTKRRYDRLFLEVEAEFIIAALITDHTVISRVIA